MSMGGLGVEVLTPMLLAAEWGFVYIQPENDCQLPESNLVSTANLEHATRNPFSMARVNTYETFCGCEIQRG